MSAAPDEGLRRECAVRSAVPCCLEVAMVLARRQVRAVHLQLGSDMYEVSEDPAVFVTSPASAWAKKRKNRFGIRRAASVPGEMPSYIANAVVLEDTASTPAARMRWSPPKRRNDEDTDDLASGGSADADSSEGESSASDPVSGVLFADVLSEEEPAVDKSVSEGTALTSGVMSRAAEQTMLVNIKLMTARQRRRFGPGMVHQELNSPVRRRRETQQESQKFTEIYNATVDVLSQHMTLVPPRRGRNSVASFDLGAYALTPPASPLH